MADAVQARPPRIEASAWLQPLPAATRLSFCGDEAAQNAAAIALGLPSSRTPCRAVSTGARASLWLGPDERLLLAPAAEQATLLTILGSALAGHAHSLVDISQRQLAFELCGPNAALLLNAQCPLDLSLAAFPLHMCTRSVYAKSEIVLWRTAADRFHVEVWRSFSDYVLTLLRTVAREFPPTHGH
ncbi:MAG TPA: sarcosine oxidase subunit gamma family protein [Steroidobacteraceae bacterium]